MPTNKYNRYTHPTKTTLVGPKSPVGLTVDLTDACMTKLVERLADVVGHRVVALAFADQRTTCADPTCNRIFVYDKRRPKYCSRQCADAHRQRKRRQKLRATFVAKRDALIHRVGLGPL